MNVKRVIAVFLLLQPSFAMAAGTATSNSGSEEYGGYVGEAAQAVIGRVFGVEGQASDIRYHEFELTAHSPRNATIRSLLVPGWGQYFNHQRVKGSIFFLCAVGSAVASARLYSNSRDSYDEYKNKGAKSDSAYDDYSREHTQSLLLGGAAVFFWLLGALDANKNAYSSLYSRDNHVELALSDDGGAVRFKQSF